MNTLPLIERELRKGAKRPGTYWMRFGVAASVCIIWLLILATIRGAMTGASKALLLFWAVAIPAFGFCLLAGLFLTADCISGEKREGTLGLLFLTDLEGRDVIIGKLAATSLRAAYNLLGTLPLLALPLLIGGVAFGEFWRVAGVLAVTLFLSLSLGLAISVVSLGVRQAMVGTLLVLLALAAVPCLIWWVAATLWPASKSLLWLLLACPPVGLVVATDKLYSGASGALHFWAFLCVQLCLGVAALAIAGRLAPRMWTEGEERASGRSSAWGRWFRFGSAAMQRRRRKSMDANPFYWLASRDRLSLSIAWMVVASPGAIWLVFLAASLRVTGSQRQVFFAVAVFLAYGAFVFLKSLVAIEAARRLSEDRQNGALELLLVTPLEVAQMLAGQRRALNRIFVGPGLVVMFLNVALLWRICSANPLEAAREGEWVVISGFLFAVGAFLLAADLAALSYTGMWIGLRTQRFHHALTAMLVRTMLVPWMGIVLLALILVSGVGMSAESMFFLLFGWSLLSVVLDVLLSLDPRDRLGKEFRLAACGDRRPLTEAAFDAISGRRELAPSG